MTKYNNSQNNININTPVTLSGAADITATLEDYIIGINDTTAARTVTLPSASTTGADANTGKIYIIKDQSGGAGTNHITIVPASGPIDGNANILIDTNYGEVHVYSDGAAWYSSAGPDTSIYWVIQAIGTALLPNKGFISTAATDQNFPLPAIADVGTIYELTQSGAGLVTITQGVGQSIRFGNSVSTTGAGGSISSSNQGDSIKLVCTTVDTEFQVVTGSIGNWLII